MMIANGQCYFLSRPRRFGKSLFVSTLKEILEGHKHIFQDLWIGTSDYHWNQHAVIALTLSSFDVHSAHSFRSGLCRELAFIARQYEVTLTVEQPDAHGWS